MGNGEDHTDDHKIHNDNDVDENADFGAEKALKICENKINEKEKCLSTVFATDEASCNRSDEKLLNQQNPSNNLFETNLFTLETKKAHKNVGSETEKIVNDESYPTNTKIFENPSESSEISCSTEAHTYSMPYCLPQQNREESSNESNYVEEISQVVPPFELDENDSLEESDETETFLEGTKQTKNHFETKTDSNNGKNLSEENIDCGLGDSLMEDGAEVLSTIDKPLQKYFIHEQQPFNNLAQKTEKGNAEVAHSKKLNRADTRIAAIFSKTSKATDNQNIENNSIKNKSKIPHITVKPLSKPDSNFKTQEKKDISAPKVSPVVKTNKVKGYKTGLKKPTNIKQSSVKVESQNQKKVNNSTRHSKHDFKINLSHHNSNNETFKKPVNQGVIRPLQNHNHKTSEHLMEDKETAHSQVSNENEFIYNNMDDSLEDFTTLAVDMTDSLEEVSGILDEPSYLDGLVDDDFEEKERDVKNIDLVDEKKRIDFLEDLREVSSFVLNRKEDFKNDEERELRVFEDAENLTTSLETGFHDDSKDIDQSHFIEQSENELLLNLASHNVIILLQIMKKYFSKSNMSTFPIQNDVDSFILLLGRTSISKQQRQHCWMCLERISCNFSRSSSFNAHLRFIFSSIEKLSMHLSHTRSPLKVAFNLSKNSESILFILSTKVGLSCWIL